jgi:hypothetical protein
MTSGKFPERTARRTDMWSLDIPRTTCVVSLLLFATAIGHVIVSGDSHSKNLLYSPPVTIEASGSERNL